MELKLYQVDAFTSQLFKGNPAAVIPLEQWLPDDLMQSIALENNLSETVFFVAQDKGYRLRWFTPKAEVDLCGHATVAAAYVIANYLDKTVTEIHFYSNSGPLKALLRDHYIQLDFPAIVPDLEPIPVPEALTKGSDQPIQTVYHSAQDYLAVLESQLAVQSLVPNLESLAKLDNRGVIFTAKGDDCDFVSRCFFPKYDVDEDPVTGSAHCVSAPYWGRVLDKTQLKAKQLSRRGGEIVCELVNDRVLLLGQAVLYMQGTISLSA